MRATQKEIIENLTFQIPTPLQYKHMIIPDQINGKTFALAEISEKGKRSEYYIHTPISDFMNKKEMYCYLKGMQKQIEMYKHNKMQ